ncbi:NAD(P)H-binding protein [Streptomyces sp. NPDC127068]|uniref:NAD(P)H-binding protein n=1 Tax=Streptomyces sp. NPDC127068 TaxID=3347127 RepID=UPI00364F923A
MSAANTGEIAQGPPTTVPLSLSFDGLQELIMIVITGATGNVGRPLVAALAGAGERVTAVSRRPVADAGVAGVRSVAADLGDAASLRPALEGADALFLMVPPDVLGGGGGPDEVVKAAVSSGVRKVVVLSSLINGTRPQARSHEVLRVWEEAVQGSGLDWTVLRPGSFATNTLAWADSVRAERTVYAPFGEVALPVVDPDDLAAVAAMVLREEGHAGRVHELTGPAAVSPREQTAALGAALGIPLVFVELTRAQARARMVRFLPEAVADGTLDVLGAPLPGERRVSPAVEALLGRAPGSFRAWADRVAAAFR